MIDRSLNWGRDVIVDFTKRVAPFGSVLDLGAGHGDDLEAAKTASPGAELFAVESWPENVTLLESRGVHVTPLNLERERLPFADASLDLIMANQIFEHLKEIFWVLHECSRTLKVGGHLLIGVPNLASMHSRLLLLFGEQPTCLQNHSAHVRGYTKSDLKKLFQMVFPGGYEFEASRGSNFYPFPGFVARPLARVFPNHAVSIFLLLKKKKAYSGEFLEHPIREKLETNYFLGDETTRAGHLVEK